jgi:hypothetical protein
VKCSVDAQMVRRHEAGGKYLPYLLGYASETGEDEGVESLGESRAGARQKREEGGWSRWLTVVVDSSSQLAT